MARKLVCHSCGEWFQNLWPMELQIQNSIWVWTRTAESKMPFWSKEDDKLIDILVEMDLYNSSNCSLVKRRWCRVFLLLHIFFIGNMKCITLTICFLFLLGGFVMKFPADILWIGYHSFLQLLHQSWFFSASGSCTFAAEAELSISCTLELAKFFSWILPSWFLIILHAPMAMVFCPWFCHKPHLILSWDMLETCSDYHFF